MDNLRKYTHLTAAILGVVTPCLLLSGYVYHLGYVTKFGLNSSLMSRGFSDVITESWYIGVLLLTYLLEKWWWFLVFFGIMATIAVCSFFYFVRLENKGVDIFANPITKANQGRTVLGFTQWHWICCGKMLMGIGSLSYIPLAVVSLIAAIVILPFQKGGQNALKEIESFRKDGCEVVAGGSRSFSRCVYLMDISSSNPTVVAQGLLVTTNNERIAIFTEGAIEVWSSLDKYKLKKAYLPKAQGEESAQSR